MDKSEQSTSLYQHDELCGYGFAKIGEKGMMKSHFIMCVRLYYLPNISHNKMERRKHLTTSPVYGLYI